MIDKKDVTKENVRQYLEENKGKLIDLSGANLSGANLRDADLIRADLIRAKILDSNKSEITLKKAHDFRNLYKYSCILFIAENNDIYIKMGCFTRKKEDWESDFYNNNSEFPEGAQQTLLRKNALDFIINYAKIMGYCNV